MPALPENPSLPPRLDILGTQISLVQIPQVLDLMEGWIREGGSHYLCLTNVHSVMTAQNDPLFRQATNQADLAVPDGMPPVDYVFLP